MQAKDRLGNLSRSGRIIRIFLISSFALLSGCATMGDGEDWQSDIPPGRQIAPTGMTPEQAAAELTSRSLLLLGTPYRAGGRRPSEGFDCSGFVHHVVKESFGLRPPRTSEDQSRIGTRVSRSDLVAGDLVFFNTTGRRNSHVGVYLGEGRFVHAPTRRGVVRIDHMSQEYWDRRFNTARRLIASSGGSDD